MPAPQYVALAALFIPLAAIITYMDVRYRRIPNKFVLIILLGGLIINTLFDGFSGLRASLGGLVLAFSSMFFFHLLGTMGAGDVKLFAAIGSVIGLSLVLPTLVVVAITGAAVAVFQMFYVRRAGATMSGVAHFFFGLLPGQRLPRFEVPAERSYTIPYAVPICFGSLISFFVFRASGVPWNLFR